MNHRYIEPMLILEMILVIVLEMILEKRIEKCTSIKLWGGSRIRQDSRNPRCMPRGGLPGKKPQNYNC